MLREIDGPDTVLPVEPAGNLDREDYRTVPDPGLSALPDTHGATRCVFVFGDDYTGLTVGGSIEDSSTMPGDVRCSQLAEVQGAVEWAAG